ncbi:MAG: hypothetical protein NTV34_12180 [Proteobacteria bacterium]|nr:hypothetical protein [Pseudomonadota bacterium]
MQNSAIKANYAVLNIHDALGGFSALENVGEIYGYGYWGAPSRTARTPFKKLVFGVFAISKASSTDSNDPLPSVLKIEMPTDLFYPVEK